MLIRVGHSPDPDDAFMFHALANEKIPTGDYQFTHQLQDIQTLNDRALKGELELTAVSLHGYAYMTDKYALCSCGCSMGDNYGPMIVARQPGSLNDFRGKTIAVPGKLTTAFLALRLALGDDFTPSAQDGMQAWLNDNPQDKFGKHEYKLGRFGLSEQTLRPMFERYLSKYEVEREG